MKNKHTPAPWSIIGNELRPRIVNEESTHEGACDGIRQVCIVRQGDYEIPNYEEAQANALLISAAPDMLTALQAVSGILTGHRRPTVAELNRMQEAVQSAIARATQK